MIYKIEGIRGGSLNELNLTTQISEQAISVAQALGATSVTKITKSGERKVVFIKHPKGRRPKIA